MSNRNSEVRALAERIAKIDEEISERQSDRKEVLTESKLNGYDPVLVGKVAKLIGMENEKRRKTIDQADLFITYVESAGLRQSAS